MTRLLVLVAKLDIEKRWMAAAFLWILTCMFCFLFVIQPKLLAFKKVQLEIMTKEKQVEVEKAKGKELAAVQEEIQKLQLELDKKQQERKKNEDILRSKLTSGTPYLTDFFSTLARQAKQAGAKFVSIRPVDEASKETQSVQASGGAQKAVEVSLIGKYATIVGILMNLERYGPLSSIKQFHLKEDKGGYPFLELKMTLGVVLS